MASKPRRVLLLGSQAEQLIPALRTSGDTWELLPECPPQAASRFDFLVSFGFRRILQPHEYEPFEGRAINIHISFLPWNRGADPNFWSWLDRTPKGVSIHAITKGLDTGPVLVQTEVTFDERTDHTLRTTYAALIAAAKLLFEENWGSIRSSPLRTISQPSGGSYHRAAEKDEWMRRYFPLGLDTPVAEIEKVGRGSGMNSIESKLAIIDEIERVRAANNVNWMDLLRLAFRVAPDEAKLLVRKINSDDRRISELIEKLGS